MNRAAPPDDPTTIVAQLTPRGRAAIATILVSGERAAQAIAACFRPVRSRELPSAEIDRILFGTWGPPTAVATGAAQRAGEELVVCRVAAWQWEIHCHGGDAAVRAIVDDLVSQGCTLQSCYAPALCGGETPLQQQARRALSQATTEFAAIRLLEQFHGALETELHAVLDLIATQQTSPATSAIERLRARAGLGRHLLTPWQVVLAGPPNVGKSSLINALLGYERSLVFDQPGTTRDVVQVHTALRGWPVTLSDTAGLRASPEALEALGIAQAERQMAQADLILNVVDVTTPGELRRVFQRKLPTSILVVNKADLGTPNRECSNESLPDSRDTVLTSTVTGMGLDSLMNKLLERLINVPLPPGCGLPFLPEHAAALDAASEHLARNQLDAATTTLNKLLRGESSP